MKSPAECEVCNRLAADYEAATMDWFRVQGQLRIAEHSHDENASSRIIAQLSEIAERRHSLRDAKEQHEVDKHPQTRCAGS